MARSIDASSICLNWLMHHKMHHKMLVEENWIIHRHELDGNQELAAAQGLNLVPHHSMTTEPLEQRQIFPGPLFPKIQFVDHVVNLLTGMRSCELPGEIVSPGSLTAQELENHFWCQGTHCPKKRVGGLVAQHTTTV